MNPHFFTRLIAVCCLTAALPPVVASAQTDAAQIYRQANELIRADCPASSGLEGYLPYPPYSRKWQAMEQTAYRENWIVFDTAHQADATNYALWRPADLKMLRNLANQIGDAAAYLDLTGNDAQAIQRLRDNLHMADLLDHQPRTQVIQFIVADQLRDMTMDHLMVIASDIRLTSDPANQRDVQLTTVKKLIADLQAVNALQAAQAQPHAPFPPRWAPLLNRCDTECHLAAMSMACHLFLFERHRWPNSLQELIPDYLSHADIDPWGDGKQTLGFVLIPRGRPDHLDRPLVYSRENSRDGLFFFAQQPYYTFYRGDGTSRPLSSQKSGGQFRDVSRWLPAAGWLPTTQPLP